MSIFTFFTNKKPDFEQNTQFVGKEPEVNKWIVSDFIVSKIVPIVGVRPYPLSELEILVSTLLIYRPTHVCDWGTHVGKATRIFYETVTSFNLKTKIISIDLPESVEHVEHPHENRGRLVLGLPGIKLLLGDGVTTAVNYLKKYNQKNVRPMFLLDGDHAYKSVKRELRIIDQNYKNAAIIIHDTFYQTEESHYNIGPYLAVTEFVAKNKNYKVIQSSFGLPGMTVLLPTYGK
jgi:cephalosporin hydroxylase